MHHAMHLIFVEIVPQARIHKLGQVVGFQQGPGLKERQLETFRIGHIAILNVHKSV